MRILVTGGSGFIGRHVSEALAAAHEIIAPPHTALDVTDTAQVDAFVLNGGFDAIIHAAVQGGPEVLETTLRGYWNLARNAGRVGRVIHFGSGAEYGKHRDLRKVSEERIGEEVPRDPYGFAKLVCNDHCRKSANIVNLRLFGVYGPYEGYKAKFISNSVAKALCGLPLVIRQDVVFDYLWIDDLVRALPRFLEGDLPFRDFNVTPAESVSLTRIASLVLRETGRPEEIEIETPGLNREYTGDNGRLMQVCPELTFTPIEEGVRKLVAWYRAHLETVDREMLAADEYRRRCATRPPVEQVEKT